MIHRRSFLKRLLPVSFCAGTSLLFCGSASLLLREFQNNMKSKDAQDILPSAHLRPPGALEESAFLASCARCYVCGDACEIGAIKFYGAEGGGAHDTPYIQPSSKGCNLCMKCTEVCPTGAIRKVKLEQVKMGVARVDKKICPPHQNRGVCGACHTACPLRGKAITLGIRNAPTVHEDKCVGCGMCVELCIVKYKAIRVVPVSSREPEQPPLQT